MVSLLKGLTTAKTPGLNHRQWAPIRIELADPSVRRPAAGGPCATWRGACVSSEGGEVLIMDALLQLD